MTSPWLVTPIPEPLKNGLTILLATGDSYYSGVHRGFDQEINGTWLNEMIVQVSFHHSLGFFLWSGLSIHQTSVWFRIAKMSIRRFHQSQNCAQWHCMFSQSSNDVVQVLSGLAESNSTISSCFLSTAIGRETVAVYINFCISSTSVGILVYSLFYPLSSYFDVRPTNMKVMVGQDWLICYREYPCILATSVHSGNCFPNPYFVFVIYGKHSCIVRELCSLFYNIFWLRVTPQFPVVSCLRRSAEQPLLSINFYISSTRVGN